MLTNSTINYQRSWLIQKSVQSCEIKKTFQRSKSYLWNFLNDHNLWLQAIILQCRNNMIVLLTQTVVTSQFFSYFYFEQSTKKHLILWKLSQMKPNYWKTDWRDIRKYRAWEKNHNFKYSSQVNRFILLM